MHWLFELAPSNVVLVVQNIHFTIRHVLRFYALPATSFIRPIATILHLRRGGGSDEGGVSLVQVLGLALLAVLFAISLCPYQTMPPPYPSTHLPLGEPELALTPSLGSDPLVLLERAAHDAGCDRDVAVVAVQTVNCGSPGTCEVREAYEMPAAFHANAIVMVGWGVSEVWGGVQFELGVVKGWTELARKFAARRNERHVIHYRPLEMFISLEDPRNDIVHLLLRD